MLGIGRLAICGGAAKRSEDYSSPLRSRLNSNLMTTDARKPYHEMTPAERLADRIAKNRGIQERVAAYNRSSKAAETSGGQRPVPTVLDEFQQIKRRQGIDTASEFVRGRQKQVSPPESE
jgi:hypothetical protein